MLENIFCEFVFFLSESQIKPIKRFHRLFSRHCESHFLPSLRAFEKCVAISCLNHRLRRLHRFSLIILITFRHPELVSGSPAIKGDAETSSARRNTIIVNPCNLRNPKNP